MCLVKHIAQLVGKYAAVPKRTLRNVLFGRGGVGLFLKGLDRADSVGALRNNVAVLFAGIVGSMPMSERLALPFPQDRRDPLTRQIVIVDIRINRADNHSLIEAHALYIVQIGCGQCDCREGIAAAGSTQTPTELPSWLWMDDTCVLLVAIVTLASVSTSLIWR